MSAPILQLSLSQAPVFVVNSRLGLSSAAGCCSFRLGSHSFRLPLSRSYGYILPSSLTRVLPRTLGSSPRIPVSVCSTGGSGLTRSFSRQRGPGGFKCVSASSASRLGLPDGRICLPVSLLACTRSSVRAPALPSVSLLRSISRCRCWNVCQLSISYALRLGLGPDLPWGDDRCPGTLMLSVGRILTVLFATHTNILSSPQSTVPFKTASAPGERSPTPCALAHSHGFGSVLQPRESSAQLLSTSELLRTLLMVAASEPTSWLSGRNHILCHLVRHWGP